MAKHEFEWRVIDTAAAAPGWYVEWRWEEKDGEVVEKDGDTLHFSYTSVPAWAVVERREYAVAADGGHDVVRDGDRDRKLVAFRADTQGIDKGGRLREYDCEVFDGEISQYVYSPGKCPEDRAEKVVRS